MNDYGYLIYEGYPAGSNATITQTSKQDLLGSEIQFYDYSDSDSYFKRQRWASFENEGLHFDDEVWVNSEDEDVDAGLYLSHLFGVYSKGISRADGSVNYTITIVPSDAYSNQGVTLRTMHKTLNTTFTWNDTNGSHTKTFTEVPTDEFYNVPYEGLTRMEIQITLIEPYSFVKVLCFAFGRIMQIDDKLLVEAPELTYYFSHTGDELPINTLDFTIFGDKKNYMFVSGERIRTNLGKKYYVENSTYNSNGTISVSCYDELSLLDANFDGMFAGTGITTDDNIHVETAISTVLAGTGINYSVKDRYNQYVIGGIEPTTVRDALSKLLLGNLYAITPRYTGEFWILRPTVHMTPSATFDETNICSIPEVEYAPYFGHFTFDAHVYSRPNGSDNKTLYEGYVNSGIFTIKYNEMCFVAKVYVVTGQTSDGEDILTELTPGTDYEVLDFRYYSAKCRFLSQYVGLKMVITGLAIDDNSYTKDWNTRMSDNIHKDVYKDIGDIPITYKGEPSLQELANYIQLTQLHRHKISFSSLLNVNVGVRVNVSYDDKSVAGWITKKVDHFTGIYDYEVMFR